MTPALRPRIVAALRLGFPLTSAELQRMLWVGRSRVDRALWRLLDEGRVMQGPKQRARGRRWARLWQLSYGEAVPCDYLKTLSAEEKQL